MDRSQEIRHKLNLVRQSMSQRDVSLVRLRGTDWFSWVTGGSDATVLLASEIGVAEVCVGRDGAWVLTDAIEADRLSQEEFPKSDLAFEVCPWADASKRAQFVARVAGKGRVASDRPGPEELPLARGLVDAKRTLLPSERERYRSVGRRAAEAMTAVLTAAHPHWTERDLAGAGSRALWERGLHPALTLVAGARRLPLYRHPTPTSEPLGEEAMLVFCARGGGLYANLTRFVRFSRGSESEARNHACVREVEARILDASRPGTTLADLYRVAEQAYAAVDRPEAIREHHQGGTTGYLAREVVAMPASQDALVVGSAIAWNPSVRGAKVEDTFLVNGDGALENATLDPAWPCVDVRGRPRPVPLVRN